MLTVVGAGGLLASGVCGVLADRLGRRMTLSLAMASAAVAMLAFGAARGTWAIAVAAPAVGFTGDLFRPASQALVADVVALAERARAYGLLFWASGSSRLAPAITRRAPSAPPESPRLRRNAPAGKRGISARCP